MKKTSPSNGSFARVLSLAARTRRPKQASRFLNLPAEIRLMIYDYIFPTSEGFPTLVPHLHPFYSLLFICQLIRYEIASYFYPSSTPSKFSFASPSKCLTFFTITKVQTHLVTSLAIHLPDNKTQLLYPILAFVPNLQNLTIFLHTSLGGCFSRGRLQNTVYALPRRTGLNQAGQLVIQRRNKRYSFYRFKPECFAASLRPFKNLGLRSYVVHGLNYCRCVHHPGRCSGMHFEWSDEYAEKHVRLAESAKKWGVLGMPVLRDLRYLIVYGEPEGYGRMRFELGILNLFVQIMEKAKGDGGKPFLGNRAH